MTDFVTVATTEELPPGTGKTVEVHGVWIALFNVDGSFYAIDNTCPHAGGNLAGGYVEDGCAVCPWHYWAFHLDNGQLKDMPGVAVRTYKTRVLEHEGRKLVQADLPMP